MLQKNLGLTSARIVLDEELVERAPAAADPDHDGRAKDPDKPKLLGVAKLEKTGSVESFSAIQCHSKPHLVQFPHSTSQYIEQDKQIIALVRDVTDTGTLSSFFFWGGGYFDPFASNFNEHSWKTLDD